MSSDTNLTDRTDTPVLDPIGTSSAPPERLVEVRRRPVVSAALGAGASLVAVAYLARAAGGGGLLDWVITVVLGVIGVTNLVALLDARTPLLVADDLGVRLRLGRTWVGLPWGGLHEVEHRARAGWWRDGLLAVHTHYVQRVLEDLDPRARRLARLNRRLHHAALAVPLGLGTRVVGAEPDLTAALRELADGRTDVVEPDQPSDRHVRDPRLALAGLIGAVAARFERTAADEEDHEPDPGLEARPEVVPELDAEPLVASETPAPARLTISAVRAELRRESRAEVAETADLDPGDELGDDTQLWDGPAVDPGTEDPWPAADDHAMAAPDPVIGPQFAAARERLGLTVDELADRTRIRPHVIEAIEGDDFSACGGDFYARGHLRTLARVLGVDAAPLLTTYDERYADAPIDPRRVFEAELASAGSIRATRGGPNWSVLVAAVMALILCWSVARLVTGGPDATPQQAELTGSGGPHYSRGVAAKPVPVELAATGGGARVVVRDGVGKLVFAGNLAFGQKHTVQASPPVRIQSTDGAVRVTVAGQSRGRMGPAGRPVTRTYVVRR